MRFEGRVIYPEDDGHEPGWQPKPAVQPLSSADTGTGEFGEFGALAAKLSRDAERLGKLYPADAPTVALATISARPRRPQPSVSLRRMGVLAASLLALVAVVAIWSNQGAAPQAALPKPAAGTAVPGVGQLAQQTAKVNHVAGRLPSRAAELPAVFAPQATHELFDSFLGLDGSVREGLVDLELDGQLRSGRFSL